MIRNAADSSQSPQDLDAERWVLGSCFIDCDKLDDVALILKPEDFFANENATIFEAMLDLREHDKRPDAPLVSRALIKSGKLDDVGGMEYLIRVADSVPTGHNAIHYARIVRGRALLRALRVAGFEISQLASDHTADPRDLLSKAESAVFGILDQREISEPEILSDVLHQAIEVIQKRQDQKGLAGVSTGYADLDAISGGMKGGELIVVAARPGMGKSALAGNIAEKISINGNHTALFFSLEMNRLELSERMLLGIARVDGTAAKNGTLSQLARRQIVAACSKLAAAQCFIDDTPGRNMTEIAAVCRRHKRRKSLSLVIIDYLQIIEPDDRRAPRQEQVSVISARLKRLARELNVPVLCLAQLNRQAESSTDHKPKLSHLRESGAIEQDADQVWFVHRDEYYAVSDEQKKACAGKAEIIVAKNRNGRTGSINLVWFEQFTRFENVVSEYEAEIRYDGPPEYERDREEDEWH